MTVLNISVIFRRGFLKPLLFQPLKYSQSGPTSQNYKISQNYSRNHLFKKKHSYLTSTNNIDST